MSTPPRRRWSFSLRTLFMAVTLVAIYCGLTVRANRLENHARYHEQMGIESCRIFLHAPAEEIGTPAWKALRAQCRALEEWHGEMSLRSRRAIRRPWIYFEPEPARPADIDKSIPRPAPMKVVPL